MNLTTKIEELKRGAITRSVRPERRVDSLERMLLKSASDKNLIQKKSDPREIKLKSWDRQIYNFLKSRNLIK